jgi:hypothetical protein
MEKIYKEWEKKVIQNFYTVKKSSKLTLPKKNKELYAYKNKVTLVLNFINNGIPISTNVEQNKNLPPKEYIQLYHIGEKQMNKTSYGVKENDFFYPAIDTGGLTNYKQKVGTKPAFLPKKYHIQPGSTINVNNIYKTWKSYSKKTRFYGNLKKELTKALHSIQNECYIQFVKVPLEYRVTVTSQDIFDKLGIYYTRVYGSDTYAKETKPKNGMYCGISEKYITPDINKNNIRNEYKI